MPLPNPSPRREVHQRSIDMKAFARDDGLFDIEARLVDRKPFPFFRIERAATVPPGESLHDLSIRMTIDGGFTVRAIEASSDSTPYSLCREAGATLAPLIGERVAAGWSSKVKATLRGAAGCTHLMEMLLTMATTAVQGVHGLKRESNDVPYDAKAVAGRMDSCYAYSRERSVVKVHWPELYRPPRPAPEE
ncbi:MAG: DUF2889 domain-containing protein [Betaproteobacteria bacterium]|nr:DUF2889 domain-containing protein [Betaproteobacteria bacterium]MBK9607842.1 DUF2889 domain-containing protein [Betaproteobacteria bacterium]